MDEVGDILTVVGDIVLFLSVSGDIVLPLSSVLGSELFLPGGGRVLYELSLVIGIDWWFD